MKLKIDFNLDSELSYNMLRYQYLIISTNSQGDSFKMAIILWRSFLNKMMDISTLGIFSSYISGNKEVVDSNAFKLLSFKKGNDEND